MSNIGEMVKETKAREALKVGDKVFIRHSNAIWGPSLTPAKVTKRTATRITVGAYTFTIDGNMYPRETGRASWGHSTKLLAPTAELADEYQKQRRAHVLKTSIAVLYDMRNNIEAHLTEEEKTAAIGYINDLLNKMPKEKAKESESV